MSKLKLWFSQKSLGLETIAARDLKLCRCRQLVKLIKVCEFSRSRSFHDDLILQDQASGERSQDQWSSGKLIHYLVPQTHSFIELKSQCSVIMQILFGV